mmetsp:Transcript_2097/g.2813  ORF Transcript_2097/g.2813 Transcript_2097/m.2813 type:complete len:89 (+) Transcript_2097:678-944(+)
MVGWSWVLTFVGDLSQRFNGRLFHFQSGLGSQHKFSRQGVCEKLEIGLDRCSFLKFFTKLALYRGITFSCKGKQRNTPFEKKINYIGN